MENRPSNSRPKGCYMKDMEDFTNCCLNRRPQRESLKYLDKIECCLSDKCSRSLFSDHFDAVGNVDYAKLVDIYGMTYDFKNSGERNVRQFFTEIREILDEENSPISAFDKNLNDRIESMETADAPSATEFTALLDEMLNYIINELNNQFEVFKRQETDG